ncbi:hypothetical protein M1N55_02810 [Dehalococcoidia bacterium]|nr:hypothetical protein [Dehalococcoidia bacterium]
MLFEYVLNPEAISTFIEEGEKKRKTLALRRNLEILMTFGVMLTPSDSKKIDKELKEYVDILDHTDRELFTEYFKSLKDSKYVRKRSALLKYCELKNSKSIEDVEKFHEKCSLFFIYSQLSNFTESYGSKNLKNGCEISTLDYLENTNTYHKVLERRKLQLTASETPGKLWLTWGLDIFAKSIDTTSSKTNISICDRYGIRQVIKKKQKSGLFNVLSLLNDGIPGKRTDVFSSFDTKNQSPAEIKNNINWIIKTLPVADGQNRINFFIIPETNRTPWPKEAHDRYIRFDRQKVHFGPGLAIFESAKNGFQCVPGITNYGETDAKTERALAQISVDYHSAYNTEGTKLTLIEK